MNQQSNFSASWSLTTACNYKCKYCYRYTSGKLSSYEEAKGITDKLYSWGCRKLSLAGGEPMLWHSKAEVIDLIRYLKLKGIKTELITNGSYLTTSDLDNFKDVLDILTIDIDTLNNAEQVLLGRPVSHLSHALSLHHYARKSGMKIKLNTVVTSINLVSIREMCEFSEKERLLSLENLPVYAGCRIYRKR